MNLWNSHPLLHPSKSKIYHTHALFLPNKKNGTWAHLHHGTKKWPRLFFKIPICYIYENWWFSYWNLRFFELLLEHYRGGVNWLDQQTTLLHTFSPFGSFLECYLEMSCGKGWLSMSMVSSLLKYGICKWVQPRWKGNLDKFSNLQISLFISFMKLCVQVLDGLLCVFFLLVIDLEVLYIYAIVIGIIYVYLFLAFGF